MNLKFPFLFLIKKKKEKRLIIRNNNNNNNLLNTVASMDVNVYVFISIGNKKESFKFEK